MTVVLINRDRRAGLSVVTLLCSTHNDTAQRRKGERTIRDNRESGQNKGDLLAGAKTVSVSAVHLVHEVMS